MVETVDEDTFHGLINIALIDLADNHIKFILPNTFSKIYNLLKINLSNNTNIDLVNLNVNDVMILNLSNTNNKLKDHIIIKGQIETLDMSNNEIISWNSTDIFKAATHRVKHLNLSYNKIVILSNEMRTSLKMLDSVDLGRNVLNCKDCQLEEMKSWLNTTNVQVLNLASNATLECQDIQSREKHWTVLTAELNPECKAKSGNSIGFQILGVIVIIFISLSIAGYIYKNEIKYTWHSFIFNRKLSKR